MESHGTAVKSWIQMYIRVVTTSQLKSIETRINFVYPN